jgi:hypothetical protein
MDPGNPWERQVLRVDSLAFPGMRGIRSGLPKRSVSTKRCRAFTMLALLEDAVAGLACGNDRILGLPHQGTDAAILTPTFETLKGHKAISKKLCNNLKYAKIVEDPRTSMETINDH